MTAPTPHVCLTNSTEDQSKCILGWNWLAEVLLAVLQLSAREGYSFGFSGDFQDVIIVQMMNESSGDQDGNSVLKNLLLLLLSWRTPPLTPQMGSASRSEWVPQSIHTKDTLWATNYLLGEDVAWLVGSVVSTSQAPHFPRKCSNSLTAQLQGRYSYHVLLSW